jgi:MscS family membrane protein
MIEFDILNTRYTFHDSYLDTINSIWDYYVVFLVSWILLRFSDRLKFYLIKINKDKMILLSDEDDIHGSKYIQTTLDAVFKFINFAIFTAAGLATLQNLGLSLSGLLAFGGFSGIIFGFASKDLFSNIFGGIMIYLNRPFDIDDWVKSPDRDIEGTVEKIGWLVTIIRKLDKRPIYIPNSIFNNIVVENPSRMTHRRIRENFYISVEHLEKVPSISRDIKKMIAEHNGIDNDELIMVNLEHIDNLYLNMFIYCFTNTIVWSSYHDIKQDLFYKIGEIVKLNKCELAVPQQQITLKR